MIVYSVCLCFFALMNAIDSTPNMHGVAKWGLAGRAGFQQVPDALLMKQQALELDGLDILVLLNVTLSWWRGEEPPYLRPKQIAGRLNVTVRSVQRSLKKMEKKGLIQRGRWEDAKGKEFPAVFLDGLIARLEKLTLADKVLSDRLNKSPGYVTGGKVIHEGGPTAS